MIHDCTHKSSYVWFLTLRLVQLLHVKTLNTEIYLGLQQVSPCHPRVELGLRFELVKHCGG